MKNKPVNELSNEELIRNARLIRTMVIMLTVFSALLLIASVYLMATSGFSPVCIIPVAMIPIIILNANNLNVLKKEMKAREL